MRNIAISSLTALTIACSVAAMPTRAFGSVVFTSATRTISATASNSPFGGAPDTTTDSVSGFGAYDNSVQRQLQTINEPPGVMQMATAEQHSFVGADSLTCTGRVYGVDHAVSSGSGYSLGHSVLTLAFTTDAATPWSTTFSNTIDPSSNGNQSSSVLVIRDASNTNVAVVNALLGTSSPQGGVLAPGSYTLTLDISGGHGSTGTGSVGINYNWTVAFAVPSPGAAGVLGVGALFAARRRR